MKSVAIKLADGRVLRRTKIGLGSNFSDIHMMSGGVVTKKKCIKCKEFLPVENFKDRIRRSRNGKSYVSLVSKCDACNQDFWIEYSERRRRKLGIPSRWTRDSMKPYIEIRITRDNDGVEYLKCLHCQIEKPLVDYYPNKAGGRGHHGVLLYGSRCKECLKKNHLHRYYIKRCIDIFGKDSMEVKRIKSVGFLGDFKTEFKTITQGS